MVNEKGKGMEVVGYQLLLGNCKIEQTQCLSKGLSGFVMVIFWRTINKVFRPQCFQLELSATKFKGISVLRPSSSPHPESGVDTYFFPQKKKTQ